MKTDPNNWAVKGSVDKVSTFFYVVAIQLFFL